MDIHALYDIARQQNIEVIETHLPENGSLSVMDDNGKCYIHLDHTCHITANTLWCWLFCFA